MQSACQLEQRSLAVATACQLVRRVWPGGTQLCPIALCPLGDKALGNEALRSKLGLQQHEQELGTAGLWNGSCLFISI